LPLRWAAHLPNSRNPNAGFSEPWLGSMGRTVPSPLNSASWSSTLLQVTLLQVTLLQVTLLISTEFSRFS
jgi:hypothetical protein